MKFGTYTWFGYDLPFAQELRLIREAGFDNICTWWDDLGDNRRLDQPTLADRAGLRLEHAHLPYFGCNALWFDGTDGDTLIDRYCAGVCDAAASGLPTLVVHPYDGIVPPKGEPALAVMRMRRLADCCAQKQVRLAIENLGDNDAIRLLLDALVDNPWVGLCFDTGHANYTAHNDFSILDAYGDRLMALHLHDNNSTVDQHYLPFAGNLDWAAFMRLLRQTAFQGALMLEACYPIDYAAAHGDPNYAFPAPEIPPEAYLQSAVQALKRVDAM